MIDVPMYSMYTALLVDTKKVHQIIHQRYITIHHVMYWLNGKRTAETSVPTKVFNSEE